MKKIILIGALGLLLPAFAVLAAQSFTASSDITVIGVQNGSLSVNFTIKNLSTSQSWGISSSTGVFSVTTDSSSDFNVRSSDSNAVAIGYYSGDTGSCTVNTTPGTTNVQINTGGTFTIKPYATSNCCSVVSNVSTYNAYPTCGPATCATGYAVSGTDCVPTGGGIIGGGGGGGGGYVSPAPSLPYPNGTLLRAINTESVYVIDQNLKRLIPTAEIFINNGYNWSSVKVVDPSILTQYGTGTNIQMAISTPAPSGNPAPSPSIPDGALIRVSGGIDVYIVKYVGTKQFKRLILSPSVFNSYKHLKWSNVMAVSQAILDSFTTSDLVRAVNDPKVYKLYPEGDTGQKRWIETATAFVSLGFDWDAIYEINQVDRDSYVTGTPLK